MKADKYTKIVLTIIATCLVINTFKEVNIIPRAHAAPTVTENGLQYGLVPVNADGTITVKLDNSTPMEVKIVDISTYNEMPVNIKEVDGRSLFNSILPVKIKE
ncbi:hypothetical protein ACLI09_16600 [Flavobacterium sp. RHBU_24]|uniref:hypothetical protein n=1 Tax=Flavobacterium sp. RHBU_24 TaxID=3391185 RepID=UPI003984AC11